ncbi:MAG: hypothetical protein AAGA67_03390, partial [Cyanobacteria bacterium P01_F01_bin.153]
MRTILLMPEWGCTVLWEPKGVKYCIEPSDLDISSGLQKRIYTWAETLDAIFNDDYPPDSKFPTLEDAEGWKKEGHAVAKTLREELGAGFEVTVSGIEDYLGDYPSL